MGLSLDINGNYEGGGVCQNCRHNTEGINCHRCKPKFYRPYDRPLNATDVCQGKRFFVKSFDDQSFQVEIVLPLNLTVETNRSDAMTLFG